MRNEIEIGKVKWTQDKGNITIRVDDIYASKGLLIRSIDRASGNDGLSLDASSL